jgi:energy-converting hydrogenase B subunit D
MNDPGQDLVTVVGALFDLLLCVALVITALAALQSRDLFRAVVMFVAFGLLMTLAWVRLEAPDLALAEAAIGAGLTGALLLDTVGYLRAQQQEASSGASSPEETPPRRAP